MSLGGSCKALYINFFTEAMSRFPTAPLKLTRCPRSLAATPLSFTLITRTAQCLRQLPSCVAVYPRDWNSFASQLTHRYPPRLCLLCRFPQTLHSLTRGVFYVADPLSSVQL